MRKTYSELIRQSITLILDRFESDSSGYGFLDTKFDIATGKDFSRREPYFQPYFIFGWIQGRGLESLAKHYEYFTSVGDSVLCSRLKRALRKLTRKLESCRIRYEHIWFAMTPDGAPLCKITPGHSSFADLFYGKGLWCAAAVLDDAQLAAAAESILEHVFSDIEQERFIGGQQSFDPKNPASRVSPDKVPEGPRMIALGALADLIRFSPDRRKYADTAKKFIGFLLENHSFRKNRKLCFCEDIHRTGRYPYEEAGHILCDPGHGLEFTGLAGRCLRIIRETGLEETPGWIEKYCDSLPELFRNLFDMGFQAVPGGIVKSADAVSGELLNSDMPWWSLPETIRAAHELSGLFPSHRMEFETRAEAARYAFERYLQPNGFACQTRDENGRIVNVIPAVPDADPGYHTNLCLMDS